MSTLKLGKEKSPKNSDVDEILNSMDENVEEKSTKESETTEKKSSKKKEEKKPKEEKSSKKKEEKKTEKKKSPRKSQKDKLKDIVIDMFKAVLVSSKDDDDDESTSWEKMSEHFDEVWDKNHEKLTKSMKNKNKQKKKDPNAPKQPSNAYLFYTQENRKRVKEDNPELTPTEITKLLAKEWNQIKKDDNGKFKDKKAEKYYKLAEKAKKQYQSEMDNYTPPEDSKSDKKEKKKRSLTAYDLFCKDHRANVKKEVDEDEDLSDKTQSERFGEVSRRLGKKWEKIKGTSAAKKYEQKSKELKENEDENEDDKPKKKNTKKDTKKKNESDEEVVSENEENEDE